MLRDVAIIGAGQIGFAAAQAFGLDGWNVTIHARSKPDWLTQGARWVQYDTAHDRAPAADVVVDSIAYDADDIARYDGGTIGRLIAISSASVYCDSKGRTLDEAAQNGFPDFAAPITEDQSTVPPGPETYSTRKVRMEQAAIASFGERATILRPGAIHGPWSRHPREWWFVKRLLDGRTRIPLAVRGESLFQVTAAQTIGDFAHYVGNDNMGGIFNLTDEDSPTVRDIGQAIANRFGKPVEWVKCAGYPENGVGRTPWSVPAPFAISAGKASKAGFGTTQGYRTSSSAALDWLADLNPTDWRAAFPQLAAYPWDLFDYKAEDAFMDSP